MALVASSTAPGVGARSGRRRAWTRAAPGLIYLALVAAHAPLLRLPYYWDEAGYFVPAALDLLRHGWWIPRSTLANGHPPLVMAALALAWRVAGFAPLVTRATMLIFAAALVWGTARLARALHPEVAGAGVAAGVLVAVVPLVFAQATLAQLDLAAAAWIVWALVARARRRPWAYVACSAGAVLAKETALLVPATLAILDLYRELARTRPGAGVPAAAAVAPRFLAGAGASRLGRLGRAAAPHLPAAAALGAWLAYYHAATGYWMGNAQFLGFNLDSTLSLPRFLIALYLHSWQLAGYGGMFALTILALWAWRRGPRATADAAQASGGAPAVAARELRNEAAALIAAYVVFHALVGGAVLARYLLPALALYVALLAPLLARLPRPRLAMAACAAVLLAGWFVNPPYPFPFEDNLAYATFIRLHRQAAAFLERNDTGEPVITAWPATAELSNPDLGYVRHPLAVAPVANFTDAGWAGIEPRPGETVYLYSREYTPRENLLRWFPFWRRWSGRYFRHRSPLPPAAWLARWHLRVEFRAAARGQWIMIARR